MKSSLIAAGVALSAATLSAQAPVQALEVRLEVMAEFTQPRQFNSASPAGSGTTVHDRAGTMTSGGLRLLGELPGTQGWYYALGGKLEGSSNLDYNGAIPGAGINLRTTDVSIRYSYWMAGISRLWDLGKGLNLGVHGEARGEAISAVGPVYVTYPSGAPAPGSGSANASTTYLRPWVRVSIDWTYERKGLRPYFGADLGLPLLKQSQNGVVGLTNIDSNMLKSMAPAASANVYAGLRF